MSLDTLLTPSDHIRDTLKTLTCFHFDGAAADAPITVTGLKKTAHIASCSVVVKANTGTHTRVDKTSDMVITAADTIKFDTYDASADSVELWVWNVD